jgi:hypothetical protein
MVKHARRIIRQNVALKIKDSYTTMAKNKQKGQQLCDRRPLYKNELLNHYTEAKNLGFSILK